MVSKNNFRNKMEAEAKRVPHFGLRKLSVGVASVLLSTTLYFGVTAHADTNVVTANGNQDNVAEASGSVKQEYQGSKVALGSDTTGSANGQSADQAGSRTDSQTGAQSGSQAGSQSDLQSNSQTGSQSAVQSNSQSGSQTGSQSAVQSNSQSGSQPDQAPVAGQQDNKSKQTLNTLLDATSRYNGNLYIQSLAVDTPSMNPGDTVKYQAGTTGVNDSFNRYVTRTIHVVKPDHTKLADQTQTIHFVREDANGNAGTVQDDMTIKYNPWLVVGADGRPTTQTLGHFDEVALPKIPGYAAEDQQGSSIVDVTKGTVAASVVLPYMVNQEVTVVYRALGTNKPIHLVDTKTGQVVADLSVTGVPGQVINIDQTVPDGYKLAAGQSIPKSVTIDPNNVSPLDIKVDELVVDIPASSPVNVGASVPGTQNVKFTSGLSEADLNRTVTRTVTIVLPKGQSLPAGVEATHTDTVSFHRNAHFNAVTGAITYDAWTENGQHTFAQVDAPAFDGYKVNRDDVSGDLVVTPDNQNITGEITYVPVAEGATIHFYDPTLGGSQADQVINSFTVPVDDDQGGTTDTPFTLSTDDLKTNLHNLDMDDYFEIDPGTTVSGTYGPNKEYYVAVKHRIFKIDYSNLHQSSWTMPDGDAVPSKITINAIDRKINRRVTVNPPKGHTLPDNIQLQEQHAEFVRDAYVDMGLIYEDGDKEADNVTTFGPWHTAIVDPTSGRVTGINNNSASADFSGIVAPEITGYTPDKPAGAVTVTPDTVPEDITINYVANDHQGKISYLDGNTEVGSDQISGKSEAQIEVTPVAPTGYEFDEGQGAAQVITVPASGNIPPITVHVHHKIINVTPDHPVDSNGQTDTGQPIKGAHESDLNQTITRTIRVTDPQGKLTTQTQSVHLTRTATYDDVNGDVTYGSWSTGTWNEYTAPAVTGYTPSQKVPAVTVTDGTKDATVDVTYNPIQQNAKIIYQDADNADLQVGFTAISGRTGESVPINPVAPAGFEIVPGQSTPANVIVPADGLQDVTVEVQHKHITVQPGDLPKPGDSKPGNSHKQPGDGTPNQDITYDFLHRNMTRTINVTDPHTGLQTTKFTLNYQRTATIDDVTGKVTYGDWTVVDGSKAGFDAFNIPNVPGYTSKIDSGTSEELMPLNPTQDQITNWQDQTINISYTADNQSFTIDYVDSQGQPVTGGHFVVSGVTDQTVNTNAKIPTGWELMSGQKDAPKTFTFDGTKTPQNLTIKIQHKIINVPYSQNPKVNPETDKTDTNQLINGGQDFDWTKKVTRTVNIHDPHSDVKTTTQVATLHRDANYDDVTGEVTYGDWSVDNTSWAEVDIPAVPGYATDDGQTQVPSMSVDGKTTDITIDVTYSPADQVTHIIYVGPDGEPVKSYTFAGKTDQTVNVTAPIPTGWVLAPGATAAPQQIIFTGASTPDQNIKIVHGTTQITHDHSAQPGAKTPTGKAITGASQDDLNQTITRTITVHEPGKDTNTITQTAKIFRDATVDDVTGEVTYTAWSTDATDWAEYDAPVHAGYTVSQAKVDAVTVADGQKDVTVDITYTANGQTTHIIYVDGDGTTVKSYDISGKTDQTVDTNVTIPTGWVLSHGQTPAPSTITFKGASTPDTKITVEHGTRHVDHGTPDQPGTKTPTGKAVTGTQASDLNQTITRTVNITEPGPVVEPGQAITETTTTITQTAKIFRDATVDEVTGKVTYGDWSTDATDWTAVDVPIHEGFTTQISNGVDSIPAVTVKDGQQSEIIDVTYTPNPQSGKIVYLDVDNGYREVGSTGLVGLTGQYVPVILKAPAGYDIVPGQFIPPVAFATATGILAPRIEVNHHKIIVNPGDEPKPGDKISGNPNKQQGDGTPWTDVSYETLHRNMTRTINVTDPHTGLHTTTVVLHYNRAATIDDATGDVTYGNWTVVDGSQAGFDAFNIPTVAGYTSEVKTGSAEDLKALTPTQDQITNWSDQTVDIDYMANDQMMHITYVDKDGHPVDGGSFAVSGKTDQTVNTNAKIPAGWVLANGQSDAPKTITFTGKPTANIKITVEHGIKNVTHDDPLNTGDKTPTDVTINGAHENDLNQTITRTINITEPGQKTQTTTQTAKIFRDATVDEVTGKVTYGDWSTGRWSNYDVPAVPGYTASQNEVPATDVTSDTTDQTVNVSYTANSQTIHINYVDSAGKIVRTTAITGKTGETVSLNLTVPDKYQLADGQQLPTTYTFTAGSGDVTIHLSHKVVQREAAVDVQVGLLTAVRIGDGDLPFEFPLTITRNQWNQLDDKIKDHGHTYDRIFPLVKVGTLTGHVNYDLVDNKVVSFGDDWTTLNLGGHTYQMPDGTEVVNGIFVDYAPGVWGKSLKEAFLKYRPDADPDYANRPWHGYLSVNATNNGLSTFISDSLQSGLVGNEPNTLAKANGDQAATAVKSANKTVDLSLLQHFGLETRDFSEQNGQLQGIAELDVMGVVYIPYVEKTATRTINVVTPDGKTTTVEQTATLAKQVDFGKNAHPAWTTDEWTSYDVPTIPGYTASQSSVAKEVVTGTTKDQTVNITYTANAQTSAINYMINGEVIKSTPLNGVTDQTLTGLTYTAPDGYEIVEGQNLPTEYTFKAKDNAPIVVQLVHKQQLVVHFVGLDGNDIKGVAPVTVDGVTGQVVTVPKSLMPAGYQMLAGQNIPDTFMLNDNDDNYLSIIVTPIMVTVKASAPVKTGDIIPDTNGAKYPAGLTQADLIKTITRTIHIAKPNGKTSDVAQMVKFSRDATVNAATGEISYDAWVPSSRQDFEAYTPEVIDGFTVESAPSQVVTPESQDSEITLTYKQISQAKAPIYIDNQGHALGKIPDGYHVVPGQVTDKGSQLVVKDHQVVVPKVEYVTRTITVTMPNGKTRTITQRARKGTKFVAAHLPHLKGYTAEVTVGGTYGVTDATSDIAVSVHFVKSANK